jgi:hypothetical protein
MTHVAIRAMHCNRSESHAVENFNFNGAASQLALFWVASLPLIFNVIIPNEVDRACALVST